MLRFQFALLATRISYTGMLLVTYKRKFCWEQLEYVIWMNVVMFLNDIANYNQ